MSDIEVSKLSDVGLTRFWIKVFGLLWTLQIFLGARLKFGTY